MITQNQDDAPCFRFDDVRLEHLRNENHWLRQQLHAKAKAPRPNASRARKPVERPSEKRFDSWFSV